MSVEEKYDELFLNVLREEGQILPFLNTIFGFLYRRTDFYIVQENPSAKVGFPPGVAERTVRDTFRRWQELASTPSHESNMSSTGEEMTDLVIHEEEVVTTESLPEPTQQRKTDKPNSDDLSSDTYNGADCDRYRWTQTLQDVDVKVPVTGNVNKQSDVRVEVQTSRLCVSVRGPEGQWNTLVDGQLSHKHRREESIWTLLPGKQITIHLQKAEERWWGRLLTEEVELDLNRLDVSRHVTDLPDEDHMQVEKVLVQEECRRKGLLEDHQKQLDLLKRAWNEAGSPFQGKPFDPSTLHF